MRDKAENQLKSQEGSVLLPAAPAFFSAMSSAPPQSFTAPAASPLAPPSAAAGHIQALMSVIRGIGTPLQTAVSEVASGQRVRGVVLSPADEARAYAQLVQQVVAIGRAVSTSLAIGKDTVARWSGEPLRWVLMEAISDIAGAHYRATGLLQPSGIVGQIASSITLIAIEGARKEDLMPSLGRATQARLVIDMLKAMPPVVNAITRFAFGRSPLRLITEVSLELQYKAVECTRRLLPVGCSLDEWHGIYAAFLQAAGQIYAEAHFAETERVSRLPALERAAMPAEIPMNGVWDAFDRKLDLLASFSRHMAPPAPAVVQQAATTGRIEQQDTDTVLQAVA